ncbi:MAG: hypothetical protein M1354_01915 [Candidatus Marsarchaeota archaeon]|jgi:NADH-quinone oxidoreductase subunit J|nr:hypothetical protein [Candidatus Marsarchaeota archaeon]
MFGIYTVAFLSLAAVTVASSLAIFIFKRLMHAVLALTSVFLGSALIILLLGQPIVALLQLFIFVGGLSTYLMVAIAAEEKSAYISMASFIPVAVGLSLALLFFTSRAVAAVPDAGSSMAQTFPSAFQEYYPVLFAVVLLLSAAAVGSVLFIRKFIKLVV